MQNTNGEEAGTTANMKTFDFELNTGSNEILAIVTSSQRHDLGPEYIESHTEDVERPGDSESETSHSPPDSIGSIAA